MQPFNLAGNYREDMARLMQKLIIMNDVAQLSVKLHSQSTAKAPDLQRPESHQDGGTTTWGATVDSDLLESGVTQGDSFDYSDGFSAHSRGDSKNFTATAQLEILELLEAWEEPELQGSVEEVRRLPSCNDQGQLASNRRMYSANHCGNYSSIPQSLDVCQR
jgi:hypothetical protein